MMRGCTINYLKITLLKERKTSALKSSTTIIRTFFLIPSVASTRVNGKSSTISFFFNLKKVCIKTKVTGINRNLWWSVKRNLYTFFRLHPINPVGSKSIRSIANTAWFLCVNKNWNDVDAIIYRYTYAFMYTTTRNMRSRFIYHLLGLNSSISYLIVMKFYILLFWKQIFLWNLFCSNESSKCIIQSVAIK